MMHIVFPSEAASAVPSANADKMQAIQQLEVDSLFYWQHRRFMVVEVQHWIPGNPYFVVVNSAGRLRSVFGADLVKAADFKVTASKRPMTQAALEKAASWKSRDQRATTGDQASDSDSAPAGKVTPREVETPRELFVCLVF